MIPTLTTARLLLRGPDLRDFEPFAAFMADADVARFIAPAPLTREQAWRSLATSIGHWQLRGYGMWSVIAKADGAYLGRVGMLQPEGWPGLEIGWMIGKPYWGGGYATEAAAAAMAYAFATQSDDTLISSIDKDNRASQAVAIRLGETRGPAQPITANGSTFECEIWSITRAAWQARR